MSSYSTVTQEDSSVKTTAEAQNILGKGSKLTMTQPGSFVVDAPDTTLGDIVFNQFPEQVAATVKDLVGAVK